jgi:peptide/nickel transport system substrate-binding protein
MPSRHPHGRRTRLPAALITALAVVAFAGCGGGNDGSSTSADKSPAATTENAALTTTAPEAKGDVDKITWALPNGEPSTIDPIYGLDYSPSLVSSQLCDSLLRIGPGGSINPGLATVSQPNDTTLVYKLRTDARFWDGKPVTTDDVVYSLKRAAAPASYMAFVFESVKSIKATGKNEVTVSLKQPDELLNKEMSAFGGAIVEQAFSEKAGKKLGSPSTGIMCSGPFKFVSWKPGTSIELARNDAYWDPAYEAHAKRLSFRFFDDSTALAQALESGEIDGAYEVPPSAMPALEKSSAGKLIVGPSRQYVSIENRSTTGPMANADLRDALFRMIDREGIAKVVYNGAAIPAYALVTPSSWDPEAKELWAEAYKPFEQAGKVDPAAAKQLVEKSGYKGEPVTLGVLAGDATQSQLGQILQQSAAAIGVKLQLKSLPSSAYGDALVNPKADAGDLITVVSFNVMPDPLEQIGFYVSKSSPYNYTGYSDPKVDQALEDAKATLDPAKRAEILIGAQKRYEAAHQFTSFVQKDEVSFLNKRLAGAPTSIEYLMTPSLAKVGAAE